MSTLFNILAALCLLLVIYPYVIYPRLLAILPLRPIKPDPDYTASKTLLFCAYNEVQSLPSKLENLRDLKTQNPDLEIIAFDDGSNDGTYELMQAHPGLMKVIRGDGRNGKAYGMKVLAKEATGDILIFTDANVILRDASLSHLMAWYGDAQVGGVCGSLNYIGAESSTTATVGTRYWQLEEKLKSLESHTGNVMGADGSIFSIRRNLYPNFPDTVLDDLTVSMNVIFSGYRLIKVNDVIADERAIAVRSDEVKRKIRIAARAYHTHLYLKPMLQKMHPIDKFKYYSRKVIRWFGGLFFTLGASSLLVGLYELSPKTAAAYVALLVIFAIFGLTMKRGIMVSLFEIIISIFATQIGVLRAMKGEVVVVWNPSKSR